ncbi:putative Xre family DNA-binding protein [Oscillibacter valericigenes Sjm18-20]|nr:putative Xre family DNA-binding protein [Oscillibacter valericigenes Sjm18-20]
MAAVGKNIRSLRTAKHMTQDELAEKLFVSRQTVSNYETGKSHPDIDLLVKISEIFDTDVNALIYGIPVSPSRKKEFRTTAIVTVILLILGISAFILGSISQKWRQQYYIISPGILLDTFLLPCFYVLLGWNLMQVISLLFGAKPLKSRRIGRIHYLIIAMLLAYAVAIAPDLIWNFRNFIEIYQIIGTHVNYSDQSAYHFLPVWEKVSGVCIQFAVKYSIAFIIPGMALWATKTKELLSNQLES